MLGGGVGGGGGGAGSILGDRSTGQQTPASASSAARAAPRAAWGGAEKLRTLAVDLWGGHRPLSPAAAAPAGLPRRRSRTGLLPPRPAAAVAFPAFPSEAAAPASPPKAEAAAREEEDVAVDLDWRPGLSKPEEIICAAVAGVAAAIAWLLTRPPAGAAAAAAAGPVYWGALAVLFLALRALARGAALEDRYKARERAETDLGDPDSQFRFLSGLVVHVKTREPSDQQGPAAAPAAPAATAAAADPGQGGGPPASAAAAAAPASAAAAPPAPLACAIHMWHGFGANVYSWSRVQGALSDRLRALVTAHDSPAFGLTERPATLSAYSLAFNGRLGRLIQDYELASRGLLSPRGEGGEGGGPLPRITARPAAAVAAAAGVGGGARPAAAAPRVRRVLVGHSLGSASAALEAVARPGEVSALVLVAPAILMPLLGGGRSDGRDGSAHAGRWLEALDDSFPPPAASAAEDASPGAAEAATAAAEAEVGDALQRQGSAAPSFSFSSSSSPPSPSASAAPPRPPRPGSLRLKHDDLTLYVSRGAVDGSSGSGSSSDNAKDNGSSGSGERARGPLGVLLSRSVALAQAASLLAVLGLLLLLRPLLVLGLRAAVRSGDFWRKALRQAYFDPSRLDEACVDAYRAPQRVRGWESGMLRFLAARIAPLALLSRGWRGGGNSGGGRAGDGGGGGLDASAASTPAPPASAARDAAPALGGGEDAGLGQRLAAATSAARVPVLIVHGAGDRLVPLSNSFRLARAIPGATLAVLGRCGHCPQEERADALVDIVAGFLAEAEAAAAAAEAEAEAAAAEAAA